MEKIKGKYEQYCDADIARQDDELEKFVRHNVKVKKKADEGFVSRVFANRR